MYSRLGISVEDGEPDYAKLKAAIREKTELPLVFDNSVKGTAMANIDFLKTKDINRHNIAFLQYVNSKHFVVTNLNDPIVSYDYRTNFVDKMIINPYSDRTCPCGRRGCVESELTPSATMSKLREVFSAAPPPPPYFATS